MISLQTPLSSPASIARQRDVREGDPGDLASANPVTWVPFPSLRSAGDDNGVCIGRVRGGFI
jgi:hypothetical protein